ncbi:SNF2-related protein [Bradyrhizobium sp. LTSP849]|uniref:SNF2-related protein n=1 Tax=Bradyrhizobium sp. LTSP849 TaxID=1615890 RepID=UPI000B267A17|nr:SNF2-related protein [Bradyrhizobium sp. LTSP849]
MSSAAPPLTPGMRVLCRDAEWLVTRVHSVDFTTGSQIAFCTGADEMVRGHEAAFVTDLDDVTPIDPRDTRLVRDSSHGFQRAKLFLEAQLRQMPLTAAHPDVNGIGAFRPLPFQVKAVEKALQQMRPRLLLADAVGLGKTIEVGMILAELMRRGRADRILVLAKKSMLTQFQAELWNRFAIPLVRLDSVGLARLRLRIPASKNPFEVYHRIIISMDTLKDVGRYRHFLENTRWDVVVIDEAHNVAGATNPERNYSYRLARLLSRRADSMLLTTATPHNGKRETFGRLISLLDPSAIPDPKFQEYSADDIKPFFLMRFKEDIRNEAGDDFRDRRVVALRETAKSASPMEEAIYQRLAALRHGMDESDRSAILRWGLYKRFLSSPEACLSTVENSLAGLRRRRGDEADIAALDGLKDALTGVSIEQSTRYQLLIEQLRQIGWDGGAASPRVLLFTESTVTQSALAQALAESFDLPWSAKHEDQPDQVMATIHGGMADVWLAKTIEAFGTGNAAIRLLIATDVASEGVNLHHQCWHIIHYDLPWSIITLIQRNGRIDRFGQHHVPEIRYLMVLTEVGELKGDQAIFGRLVEKVEEINRTARSGESVLKLYDAEREEEFVAENGLLGGNKDILDPPEADRPESSAVEDMLRQASEQAMAELADLFDDDDEVSIREPAEKIGDTSRVRLYDNVRFLEEAFSLLSQMSGDGSFHPIEKTLRQFLLTPPSDLRRRLGAPEAGRDIVFGATAIPEEAWPEDGRLRLTTDPDRVDTAIRAARALRGQWSDELLLTELHPVMRWLSERLMMLMPRGEAPMIASPYLPDGEMCFCFIGQVSSRAGTPLIADAHAVFIAKGGRIDLLPLKEALERARFDDLADTGRRGTMPEPLLKGFVAAAVNQSLDRMQTRKQERQTELRPLLEKEESRLKNWFVRRRDRINDQLADLSPTSQQAIRARQSLEEAEKYVRDRNLNWRLAHFEAADQPTTRLILAIEGVR